MKKPIIAAGAAVAGIAIAAVVAAGRRTAPGPVEAEFETEPVDELRKAAENILLDSDKVDPDTALVTRTLEGGLVLYGQVTSSAAAGMLARRVRAIAGETEVTSRFKVAKRV